jgi:lantibiotic modifying enzyme
LIEKNDNFTNKEAVHKEKKKRGFLLLLSVLLTFVYLIFKKKPKAKKELVNLKNTDNAKVDNPQILSKEQESKPILENKHIEIEEEKDVFKKKIMID